MLTIKNIKQIEGATLIVNNTLWMISNASSTNEVYQFYICSVSMPASYLELGLNRHGFDFGGTPIKVYEVKRYQTSPTHNWPTFGISLSVMNDKGEFIKQLQTYINNNYIPA